ncbi:MULTISPECIES: MFS transporter [Olivibacter]|jgi:MFS family permease|uniref:Major facilitator superfamily MFS_1 n=3 Tax=Sphingobacteriaceae TaxID=84566 RepID=F4C6Z2_SPHS2|nr:MULTISPECIES: MFS transporter [Olivibacter]MCL4637563.1 MFS transporter [Olivibacter sp. UJ_SKK_5.1]MDX3913117.1 MFS transporter [Pseudosphingobacterium sp.]QEL01972.1 MFS transporter [Olivibacter sp. LS-1]
MIEQHNKQQTTKVWLLVLVASLGYFVDIYDLVIFSIVRVQSFKDIGVPLENMRTDGEYVLNMQMIGLLLGGLLWGIIGDKFGRVRVLFGSILLYSLANMANSFVNDIHSYAWIRFIAGIGLAGELGAGVTLVSESMPRDKRGYGTMLIAGIGVLGAIAAFYVAEHFNWRNAYLVGGGMGLLLLLMRVGTFESGMFTDTAQKNVLKGKFFMLFENRERFLRYLYCMLIGLPIWFVVGILITQAPEFGVALGATETLSAGKGIMYAYIGISLGDIFAGLYAQLTKSRKKAVFFFQLLIIISSLWYLMSSGITAQKFVWLAFFMGFSVGYWATFVTIASEQFGTNLRATVATTAPNFVRGALVPSTFLFEWFVHRFDIIIAATIMVVLLSAIAMFALSQLKESFDKDLNYLEE